MYELVLDTISLSILAIDKQSIEFAMDVISRTNRIDELERAYRKKHIERLNSGSCDAKTGIVYGDMIDNLKRMGNYAVNIAETVIIRLSNK
ncbi:Phosphate:Na+ symporter OS=Ureibacillus acetophenoni OX=614649 GN=SAMN05877842_10629 PE=4 SV=1 [Ureibacillus acetophenoni]